MKKNSEILKNFFHSAKLDFGVLPVKKTFDAHSAILLDHKIFFGKIFEQAAGTDAMADKFGTG